MTNPNPNPKDSKQFREDMKATEIAARDLARDLGYALENLNESTNLLRKQVGLTDELKKGTKALNSLAQNNANIAKDLTAMYDAEVQASNNLLLKRNMLSTGLKGDYAQMLTTYMLENNITDINSKRAQLLIKELQRRQHINEHTEKQVELTEAMAAWQEELHEELEGYTMGWEKLKSKMKALATDPKVAKAFFAAEGIKVAIEGIEGMEKRFDALKKSGLSAGQAAEGMVKSISVMSVLGLSDTEGVMQGMVEHYGNVNALSGDMVDDLGKMAVHMGITGQEAMKLNASLSQMPGETAETAKNAMEHVGHMAEMEGIAPGKIMKDMAGNTAEMARAGSKGAEAFGKSVINLHKMGVEMSTASKMADNLLDFESSINNQMEASVLLGKDINLDKARELALNNDLEGATAEVLKNVGGSAEFNKLNRLQQDALAKSLGLSVEEMGKYIDAQEEQEKYHGKASGFWMNTLGYATEYGSKIGGFLKEHGLLIISALNLLQNTNLTRVKGYAMDAAHWVKEKAHILWLKAQATFGGDATKFAAKRKLVEMGKGKVEDKVKDKIEGVAEDKASDLADKAKSKSDEVGKAKGGGFKDSMKGLADGFKKMAGGKVLQGIANTALAGPALLLALPAIPFLLFMGLTPLKMLADNFLNLAMGLEFMGGGKVAFGSLNLMLMAAGAVIGLAGIPFLLVIAAAGALIGVGLSGLATGLSAMANPMVAIGVGILSTLILSVGAGMLLFGAGVGIAAAGMSLLVASLKDVPFENLMALPVAFMGLAAGLNMVGIAGALAMPILGELILLAAVAPALVSLGSALGNMFGGGEQGKGGESEELKTLREIKNALNTPVIVKLDGKVLGEGTRQATPTSGMS
jgi:hypothetical protein